MTAVVNAVTVVVKFLLAGIANLLAAVAQIETIAGSAGVVAGVHILTSSGVPGLEQLGGGLVALGGLASIVAPQIVDAGKTAETDLSLLLSKATGKSS